MKEKYADALEHYALPQDSLKLRALLFLLDNMDQHFGTDPISCKKWVNIYKNLYDLSQKDDFDFKHNYLSNKGKQPDFFITFVADTTIITSEELIENIDLAFKAWKKPWAQHLSFDEFCAYLLPYRIGREPYCVGWRRFFIDKLQPLTDSIENAGITDPFKVCEIVSTFLHRRNKAYISPLPDINVVDFYRYPIGDCEKWFILQCLAGRAIGLPLAIDFNLQFTRFPGDHSGTVLTNDGKGNLVAFTMNEDHSVSTFVFDGVKIFREEFSKQPFHFVNRFFPKRRYANIKDVTSLYGCHFPKKDIHFPVLKGDWDDTIYFCCFGVGEEVIPLDCPEIKNDTVYLKDLLLSTDPLFLFCRLDEKKNIFTPLCNPFSISKTDGSIHFFNPDTTSEIITIRRKYPITYDEEKYFGELTGSCIQGSNDRLFRQFTTLDSISEKISGYYEFKLPPHKAFRYYRFLPSSDHGINLAELHFISDNGLRNKKYFSAPSCNTESLHLLYDDKIATNYIEKQKTSWIAVDMEANTSTPLSKVGVLARNSLNNIEKGNCYELLLFDMGWHSLGRINARNLTITCQVPKNGIFLLKNLTTGRQERIFMNENGEQNFW